MHVHETMVVAVHVGFVYQQLAVATNVYNQVADEQAPFINHFNNVKSCKINVKNYKILNVVDTEIIKRFQVCYCIICRRPGVSLRLAFTCRFNNASKLVVAKLNLLKQNTVADPEGVQWVRLHPSSPTPVLKYPIKMK